MSSDDRWYKNNTDDKIWWKDTDSVGEWLFSFDKKQRLEIDSRRKTVKLIHTDGYTENVLWSAAKEYYIFEKIASGTQIIAWDGSFSFDLILVDKRSEPLWK